MLNYCIIQINIEVINFQYLVRKKHVDLKKTFNRNLSSFYQNTEQYETNKGKG